MPARKPLDEFALIEAYFAPLAAGEAGALGLGDDAALIEPAPGHTLVTTTDMLIAGVHFPADDPADLIARKLLRVNLSDLAAMGARPRTYLLGLALPADIGSRWIEAFASGLAEDQKAYGIALMGGDTTATPGPVSLCLTAFGEVESGTALLRSGARRGDDVYVSGTIGDAALGLQVLSGEAPDLDESHAASLLARYRLPEPRTALGPALRGLANAAADVSDGLIADLGHICSASGTGAEIDSASVPLSPAAAAMVARAEDSMIRILTGGDDYELVFTAAAERRAEVNSLSERLGVPVSRIGQIVEGEAVTSFDATGKPLILRHRGYRHFADGAGG